MAKHYEANNAPVYRDNSEQSTHELTYSSGASHPSRALALCHNVAEAHKAVSLLQERARVLLAHESVGQRHNVWRHMGETTFIQFDNEQLQVRTSRGTKYLGILVHSPEKTFHPLQLISIIDGGTLSPHIPKAHLAQENISISYGGAKVPLLDKKARQQYAQRAEELLQELEEANLLGQEEEIERIRTEMEQVTNEINRASRRGGKSRTVPDPESRAANSVPHAIQRAIEKLRSQSDCLANHLTASLGKPMGTQCIYRPSSDTPSWDF